MSCCWTCSPGSCKAACAPPFHARAHGHPRAHADTRAHGHTDTATPDRLRARSRHTQTPQTDPVAHRVSNVHALISSTAQLHTGLLRCLPHFQALRLADHALRNLHHRHQSPRFLLLLRCLAKPLPHRPLVPFSGISLSLSLSPSLPLLPPSPPSPSCFSLFVAHDPWRHTQITTCEGRREGSPDDIHNLAIDRTATCHYPCRWVCHSLTGEQEKCRCETPPLRPASAAHAHP